MNEDFLFFKEGYLYLEEVPVVLFPYPSVLELFQLFVELPQHTQYSLSKEESEFFNRDSSFSLYLQRALHLGNYFGLGKISLLSSTRDSSSFLLQKSLLERIKSKYSNSLREIESGVEAFFTSYLELFMKKKGFKLSKKEKREEGIRYIFEKVALEERGEEKNLVSRRVDFSNSLLWEVLVKKQLLIEEGSVSLWRTPGAFLPLSFLNFLFEHSNKEALVELSQLAYFQGRLACKRQLYFLCEKKASLKQIVNQCELVGFGPLEFEEERDKARFHFTNPKKDFELFLEYYVFYVFKGIYEEYSGFNSKLDIEEKSSTFSFSFQKTNSKLLENTQLNLLFQEQIH